MKKTKNIFRTLAIMCIAFVLLSFNGEKASKHLGVMPHVISLWETKNYCDWGKNVGGEFHSQKIVAMLQKTLGFKVSDVSTWNSAVASTVNKFSSFLSAAEKKSISDGLSSNARLLEDLAKLDDNDLARLIELLDITVKNQDNRGDWIYLAEAEPILQEEYNILAKVWNMPQLFKSEKNYLGGHYYSLGKKVSTNPWANPGDDKLLWNTRYLNVYQYAAGVFHRRCREVGAITPAARREVARKISSSMKQGAALMS